MNYEVVCWRSNGPQWVVEFHSYTAAVEFGRKEAVDERNTYSSIVLSSSSEKLMSWSRNNGVEERLWAGTAFSERKL